MGKIFSKDKLKRSLSFVLLFLLAAAYHSYAASRDVELLNKGYGYYLSYQPKKAVEEFNTFLKEFPQSSARDTALYWLGMSYLQLKEFDEARKVFSDLKENFPESPFFSHADKELETIMKAESQPAKAAEPQVVQNENKEKVEDTGKGGESAAPGPVQQVLVPKEENNEKLPAEVKEQQKGKEAEASQAKELEGANEKIKALQLKVTELKKAEKKADALEEKVKALTEEKKQNEALQAKIKALEEEKKRSEELEAKVAKLEEDKKKADELQTKLRAVEEEKQKPSEPAANQIVQQVVPDEGKKNSEELKAKIRELAEEKKKSEELHTKVQELEGKESYLQTSSAVLSKLGMKDVLWRSGNIREDLANEDLLYQEAKKLHIEEDLKKQRELTRKYKFTPEQEAYLSRYLTICSFIDRKLQDMPAEDVFEQLIVDYDEETRYTKIVLASELQTQAKSGMSFEEIYKLYPDLITFEITGFDELPDWIQEKVGSMAVGEFGVVWSEEGYRMLKRTVEKPSLNSCGEIRPETRDKIKTYIAELLKEIKEGAKSSGEQSGGGDASAHK